MTRSCQPGAAGSHASLRSRLTASYLLGALALLLAVADAASRPAPAWWHLLLQVALLGPGLFVELPLRLGNRRLQVAGFAEAAVMLSLAAQPGPYVVLLITVIGLGREVRLRRPLSRALFNTAVLTAPAFAAVHLHAALAPPAPDVLRQLLALAAAAGCLALLNQLLVAAVVAAATAGGLLDVLRQDVLTDLARLAANVGLAGAVLAAVQADHLELAAAAPLVLLELARRSRARLLRDTTADALPRLQQAAEHFSTLNELEAAREVLERAASLFGLEQVQLVLFSWPARGDQTHTRTGPGTVTSTAGRPCPDGNGEGHVLTVPLALSAGEHAVALGELRLTFPRRPALADSERQVLATFTSTTVSWLSATRSYAEQFHAARTDSLTGLANRLALAERVDRLLPQVLDQHTDPTGPPAASLAVLLIDLDHFKEVNNSLGHSAGDTLLVELARRLAAGVRPGDLVARLGGDEFAVLLQDVPAGRHAMLAADALLIRLNQPVSVDGLELPVEASIGVALAPGDATCLEQLLRCADVAMYRAKTKRNTAVVYDPVMDPAAHDRLRLVAELQHAIRADQLVVHYQPIVDLRTAHTTGAEALVRWQHPERGLLLPDAFVPAVERTALIVPLTLEVLDQAVREAVSWPPVAGRHLGLSVNLSARCLLTRNIPDQTVRILVRHGLPAHRLTLEITETLALVDLEVVDDVLTRLREIGVQLSVDDFGTGYSSMSFLRKIAVHEVKVDRSFVADAPRSPADRAIVTATVALAHGLGLTVVGEGVETPAQLQTLLDSGCDAAQGYLLGKPVPAEKLRAHLHDVHPELHTALAGPPPNGPGGHRARVP